MNGVIIGRLARIIAGVFVVTWIVAAIALFVGGCHGGALGEVAPVHEGSEKTILAVGMFLNHNEWRQSPWARLTDDPFGPVYVIIADDRSACVVSGSVWAIAHAQERWPCPSGWRLFRP